MRIILRNVHEFEHILVDLCPWLTPTEEDYVMKCQDGSYCSGLKLGWSCCKEHGGRAKCPAKYPSMCAMPLCAAEGTDYCCMAEGECKYFGGLRPCEESGKIPQRIYSCRSIH